MSDFKSKLPDLSEIGSMAGKLFKDVRESLSEIISDYKKKRATEKTTANESESTKEETVICSVKKTKTAEPSVVTDEKIEKTTTKKATPKKKPKKEEPKT